MSRHPELTRVLSFLTTLFLASLTMGTQAEARNVPGSAAATTLETSEIATAELADGILDALKGNGPSVGGVNRDASGGFTFSTFGTGFQTSGGFVGGASLRYHGLDVSGEFEGDLITGAFSFGRRLGNGTLVYASVLLESLDVDTPYNTGTLDGSGYGMAIGFQTEVVGGFTFSSTLGALALDYDMTRSGGAVSASYDADRWFLDLRGTRGFNFGSAQTELDFGLRYVEQSDSAYVETGGGAVAAVSYSSAVAFLNSRTYLSENMEARPYIQGNLRGVFGDTNVPGTLPDTGDSVHGFIGIGLQGDQGNLFYDTNLGAHFDEDGYSGFGAKLSVSFRF